MFCIAEYMLTVTILLLAAIGNHLDGSCDASVQVHHQTTQNDYLNNDISQEKMDQLSIPKNQTLIVRLPSNTLLKYTSYKDVSILHFRVPPDTRTAFFTFKAYEESKSAFQRKCKPRDVTLHLKAASYPVISPENITFPRNFLNANERFKIYNLQFKSDEEQQRITVEGPYLGNWFAVAFVSWTDPNNERIEQQGLTASCDTLLLAEMSVAQFRPIILNDGQVHSDVLTRNCAAHIDVSNQTDQRSSTRNKSGKDTNVTSPLVTVTSPTIMEGQTTMEYVTAAGSEQLLSSESINPGITSSEEPLKSAKSSGSDDQHNRNSSDINNSNSSDSVTCNGNVKFIRNNDIIYKFYVPPNIGGASSRITIDRVQPGCPDVGFQIQANAFPAPGDVGNRNEQNNNYVHSTIIKPNQTGEISIEFYVQPDVWHYAFLAFVNEADASALRSVSNALSAAQLKLLNKLKINSSAATTTTSPVGGTSSKQQQQRLRHSRKVGYTTWKDDKYNETIECSLEYSLQINFDEPFGDGLSTTGEYNTREEEDTPNTSPSMDTTDNDSANSGSQTRSDTTQQAEATSNPWRPVRFRNIDLYPLLRQTYREFFMFDYDLMPDANGTVPAMLNLTGGTPVGFTFQIGEVYDIGGTLSYGVSMKHDLKGVNDIKNAPQLGSHSETEQRSGILAEKLIAPSAATATTASEPAVADESEKSLSRSNQTIIVCIHLGEPGEPIWPDKCRYGHSLLPASSIVNNTDSDTSSGLIHVPFPESGQWYVTMALYCHGAETAARATIIDSVKGFVREHAYMLKELRPTCSCYDSATRYLDCVNDNKCFTAMNEAETLKVKECLMDSKCTTNYIEMTRKFEVHHKLATEQHFALDNCNTSVVFTISSSPCVAGRCGRFGRCYHYMSGGFVFSTCVCIKGYRGWDCTEDSQVPSSMSILMASLLLTLSNLLFFPSIYMAMRRKYYTEAVIYFFAMFFSIFYHACDSGEDEYSFCLVKIGVLQFCDFYCGLLAIWVTLVAMSHVRPQLVSLLHMFGAIMLAFGTELNKQSLWVFLAPALTGICIISVSWGLRCYKTRKWFPTRKYLTIFMPLGMVLVMVGLVCYAFLQTKQNYHIVHSVWHMVMALSILCLLPSRKSFMQKC